MHVETLIRGGFCLLLTTLAGGLARADHGGTAKFDERNRKLRQAAEGKVRYERLNPEWDGDAVYYKREGAEGWHRVSLADGKKSVVEKKPEIKRSKDGRYLYGLKEKPKTLRGHTSPDKKWKVEVREDRKVVLREVESEEETVLAEAPEEWLYTRNVVWSPNSKYFVGWIREDVKERIVTYVRSSPEGHLQPRTFTRNYAKPGDKLSVERPVVFSVDGKEPIQLKDELAPNPFSFRRHRWRTDGNRFAFEFIERGFGKYRLLEINAESREQRIVVKEDSETFVFVFGKTFRHDFNDGEEIVWLSERDGWNHLYLMDGKTGEVKKQLTKGEWLVREVVAVNDEKKEMLLRLNGYYPGQDPYFHHWARLDVASGKLTLLTEGDGMHNLRFSPDGKYYVDSWSRVDHPPVHELRKTEDGSLVTVLEKADASELLKTNWMRPEVFVCKDRNDKFDIWGVIWRPRDFDPKKKYAVIENIYAGPQGSFVPKTWSVWAGTKSTMTERGFIVVQIDGLGTSNRCREFHHFCYKNLKDAGLPDRIKWLRTAAKKYPQLDLDRVGIYGGSAGGQSSLGALLFHNDFYDAAVSDCGCHDNRMDKIWWNEQWMDWPIGDHYAENSNTTHVEKLKGHLLLTVGEVDTNVDPSSTMQVVNALIKADKDFEFIMVPSGGHGIGESPYLKRKRVEFFERVLGGPVAR